MVVGMLLGGLAFVVAGFVQLRVQSVLETLGAGQSKLVIYNNAPFDINCEIEATANEFSQSKTLFSGEVSFYSFFFHLYLCTLF